MLYCKLLKPFLTYHMAWVLFALLELNQSKVFVLQYLLTIKSLYLLNLISSMASKNYKLNCCFELT